MSINTSKVSDSDLPTRTWRDVYNWNSLTRTAPPTANRDDPHGMENKGSLAKCLQWYDLVSYGVGSTVGAGLFVTVGLVLKSQAGPGVLLSFLFAAAACLISAFAYTEFSTRIPLSGSAYTFSYVSLGELAGWFIGWDLTLEYCISASAVARGWGSYVSILLAIFKIEMPSWLVAYDLNEYISISPLSALIILLCTCILILGVKDSARFNMVITIVNITTILFVIILGAFHVDTKNWHPFLPYGIKGAFTGAGTVFFSYIGFDSVTTLAGEVQNPGKDLPIGIVGTLLIATCLYVGASLVISGMVNYTMINIDAPLSTAFDAVGLRWAAIIISVGSVTALTATTLCSLLGQPRIYYQMARDGLFFKAFGTLNKAQVPIFGTIFTGLFAGTLSLFLDLNALANMISIGTLLAFTVVCGGVLLCRYSPSPSESPTSEHTPLLNHGNEKKKLTLLTRIPLTLLLFTYFCCSIVFSFGIKYDFVLWLRISLAVPLILIFLVILPRKQQSIPKTFKCPGVPFIPLLGMLVNTFLICQLDFYSIIRVVVWAVIGFVIYFSYGIRHSNLNYTNNNNKDKDKDKSKSKSKLEYSD